jgi:hypothetical protein
MCETPSIVMMGDSYSRSAWACAQTMRCHRHESETVPHSLSMAAGARRTSRERPLRSPTSGDCLVLLWEQEAAGSNPAIPTKAQVVGLSRPDVVARAIRRAREILR